jgi:integrase
MASVLKIGNSIRAQIRRNGHPTVSQTFKIADYATEAAAKKDASEWVTTQEAAINQGKQTGLTGQRGVTVGEAMLRFIKEKPDTDASMISAMRRMASEPIGKRLVFKLTEDDIVRYIEDRKFSAATGAFHFSSLCSVMKRAKLAWKLAIPDILVTTRTRLNYEGLIGKSTKRERRPTPEELAMLLSFKYPKNFPMAQIIRFAISSTMRCSEIARIERSTYKKDASTIVITDRKHPTKKIGNHQTVPLTQESIEIIEELIASHSEDRVFPYRAKYISEVWIATCKALRIEDLHFHDLRHEGTSRLFEMGYQPQEVRMFTGHEDLNMLMRYTHLKAKDMRRLQPKEEKKEAPVMNGAVMDAETAKQFKRFQAFEAMMKQTEAA